MYCKHPACIMCDPSRSRIAQVAVDLPAVLAHSRPRDLGSNQIIRLPDGLIAELTNLQTLYVPFQSGNNEQMNGLTRLLKDLEHRSRSHPTLCMYVMAHLRLTHLAKAPIG